MENKRWYSQTEAAAILGVSTYTVKRMATDGRLNNVEKLAGRMLIPVAEVTKYLVPIEQVQQLLK